MRSRYVWMTTGLAWLTATTLTLCGLACGGGSSPTAPTPTPIPTPTPTPTPTQYSGTWSGQTGGDDARALTFNLNGREVSSARLEVRLSFIYGIGSGDWLVDGCTTQFVSDGTVQVDSTESFEITVRRQNPSLSTIVRGHMDSATSASGTVATFVVTEKEAADACATGRTAKFPSGTAKYGGQTWTANRQ